MDTLTPFTRGNPLLLFSTLCACLWALVSPRSRFDVSRDREKIFLLAQSEGIILDTSFERRYRLGFKFFVTFSREIILIMSKVLKYLTSLKIFGF